MNDAQLTLTLIYGVLVVMSGTALALVFRSTRAKKQAEVSEAQLAALEGRWTVLVFAFLAVTLALTLFWVPYGKTDGGRGAQVVTVRAQQFGWSVQPAVVQAGRPVEFRLTSRDVQHGFGVYRGTELLLQVQVPARGESEQRYVHTFVDRGTYEILCLEFCGFQHHAMRGTLRVD